MWGEEGCDRVGYLVCMCEGRILIGSDTWCVCVGGGL